MAGKYVGSMFVPDTPATQQQMSGILGIYSDSKDPFVLLLLATSCGLSFL